MTVCHHCGQDIPENVERGPLRVSSAGEVYWHGLRYGTLTQRPTQVMQVLCRRGEATHLSLEMICSGTSGVAVSMMVGKIRRNFREWGLPVQILAIRGYGYRLLVPEVDDRP